MMIALLFYFISLHFSDSSKKYIYISILYNFLLPFVSRNAFYTFVENIFFGVRRQIECKEEFYII